MPQEYSSKWVIPLEHVIDVLRGPRINHDGVLYAVIAVAWTPEELAMIIADDTAFGHLLVPADGMFGQRQMQAAQATFTR